MKYAELVTLYEELDSTSKRLEKTNFISIFLKKVPDELLDEFLLLVQGKIFPDYMDKKIGISSRLAIKAISKTTGNSENEIEGEWKKLGDLGDVSKNLLSKNDKKKAATFISENGFREERSWQKLNQNSNKLVQFLKDKTSFTISKRIGFTRGI